MLQHLGLERVQGLVRQQLVALVAQQPGQAEEVRDGDGVGGGEGGVHAVLESDDGVRGGGGRGVVCARGVIEQGDLAF